ncbi:MAG: tetratricopeptide repeat protein [Bryobacteraceae bacterium]
MAAVSGWSAEDQRSPEFRALLPTATGASTALHRQGVELIARGEWYDAVRVLRRAEAAGSTPALLRALAVAYYGARQHVLFQQTMEDAIRREPANFAPHYYFGRHFGDDQNDWARAAESFERAAALNPEHAASHAYLGYARELEKLAEPAAAEYRRAIELGTGGRCLALPRAGMARLQLADEHAAQALVFAEDAVRCDPKDANARKALARALAALGRTEGSIQAWHEALAIEPTDSATAYQLYRAYQSAGRESEAAHMLSEVKRLRKIYGGN